MVPYMIAGYFRRSSGLTVPVTPTTPSTLESAIKAWLITNQPTLLAAFGGIDQVIAGRRPPRGAATYLRIEIPNGIPGLFTSTSVVQMTRLMLTAYAPSRDQARTLGNAVDAAFKGARWDYAGTHTAPLTPGNRVQGEEPQLDRSGVVFYDRVEYLCREQKAR